MASGPGKYDDLATYVREKAEAGLVIVVVMGGNHGSGFAVQAEARIVTPPDISRILRAMAEQIEHGARPTDGSIWSDPHEHGPDACSYGAGYNDGFRDARKQEFSA